MLPPDITWIDALALAWFATNWFGYTVMLDWRVQRLPAINQRMARIRHYWMMRFLERENRIFDSQLMGQTIASVTFFASTSVLVVAGLLSVFGTVETVWRVIGESGVVQQTSRALFEAKLVLLVVIFIYGFLKFTWALRQYNYTCALMGAAPSQHAPEALRERIAVELGRAITSAISAFNGGLRAYYFALAVLAWFIQPWLFMIATTWVTAVLLYRQMRSGFAGTVGRMAEILDEEAAGARPGG
ncbi:DUF599 domain-containing protein [Arenibaculum pallidiluteum]|uniref:DUF599 domain-containing protein n=1 Tax=Arenibaculum pallidiluteum TaxID=2812559 RepID=UPI001A97A22F|nr:DUF599 domain-containing protein [Arenibaculum pallidiluteum]